MSRSFFIKFCVWLCSVLWMVLPTFQVLAQETHKKETHQDAPHVRPRMVFELFTSQGCSACPSADKMLMELAKDKDVIALSYPVAIWDHLGWHDTLATPANGQRQKSYGHARGDRRIYTPQLVVNGVKHAIGSDRTAIDVTCRSMSPRKDIMSLPLRLHRQDGGVVLTLEQSATTHKEARLVLIVYDKHHAVRIENGENTGKTLSYINVVRHIQDLGSLRSLGLITQGQTLHVPHPTDTAASKEQGVVVLVQYMDMQKGEAGAILGAAALD